MFKPTRLEIKILCAIDEYDLGTPTEVADHLDTDRANVSKAIKNLIENGQMELIKPEYRRIK